MRSSTPGSASSCWSKVGPASGPPATGTSGARPAGPARPQAPPSRLDAPRGAAFTPLPPRLGAPAPREAPPPMFAVSSKPPAPADGPAGGVLRPLGQVLEGYLVAESAEGVV